MNAKKKAEKQINALIKDAKKVFTLLLTSNLVSVKVNGKEVNINELKKLLADLNNDKQENNGMVKREKVERQIDNNVSDQLLDFYLTKTKSPVMIHTPVAFQLGRKLRKYNKSISLYLGEPGREVKENDILGSIVVEDKEVKYKEPEWYSSLLNTCQNEPNKNHILCVYGLTKVSPDIQLYFKNIIADRSVDDDLKHKLPDNCSVVFIEDDDDTEYYYPLNDYLDSQFNHIYYELEKTDLNQSTDELEQ